MEEDKNVNNTENNIEENINTENNANVNNNMNNGNAELPMDWWKFLKYFRFPVGIFYMVMALDRLLEIGLNDLNWIGWSAFAVVIVMLITSSLSYVTLLCRNKNSFKFMVLNLFVETVGAVFINAISTSLETNFTDYKSDNLILMSSFIQFLFLVCVWIVPNYVYFKKRKAYFTKKEENITI